MSEVELGCAVYGEGTVFPVKIARDAKVSALQEAIFDKMRYKQRYSFDASALTLYMAKQDGEWLKDDRRVKNFLKGDISTDYEEMRPLWKLSKKELFGPDFLPGEEEIHVLVKIPDAAVGDAVKRKADELLESAVKKPKQDVTWKQIDEPVFSVQEDNLYFVNRDRAVKALVSVHNNNWNRATRKHGPDWKIPIVDHVYGLGNTTFALHYIRKSRKHSTKFDSKFQEKLSKCHTLCIQFSCGELAGETCFNAVLINRLKEELKDAFVVRPTVLSNPPRMTRDFLEQLANEAGPVFIVLDEIGAAFTLPGLDDVKCRELFMDFCTVILTSWMLIPDVFFLLVGRSSFLSTVRERPNGRYVASSPYTFVRLDLNLLRPDKIAM